jgi:hypothetical protein
VEGRIVRPRQVRYQAALRPDSIVSLILNHFQKTSPLRKVSFCFILGAVSKLCQNPSVHPRCIITDVLIDLLIKVLLVRLPIQLH